MTKLTLAIMSAVALAVTGCGDAGTTGAVTTLTHTFPPITVGVGQEDLGKCQKWTLNNDETLYVSKVKQTNDGAWHHSNWLFVPEDEYGEDGTFNCRDREFSELVAGLLGGAFFAQSTQALSEEQVFPPGAVIEIPPRSAIVGDIHLLNVGAAPIDSALTFELEAIAEEDVEVKLKPITFSYGALDIPPRISPTEPSESRFTMTCDLGAQIQDALGTDYTIYYVLAHYHGLGNYFKLAFVDDEEVEDVVYEIDTRVGEPLGGAIDPIIPSGGAPHLRVTCGYSNNTDKNWVYGFGDGEMCVFLAYIDADIKAQAGTEGPNVVTGTDAQGRVLNEAECTLRFFPIR